MARNLQTKLFRVQAPNWIHGPKVAAIMAEMKALGRPRLTVIPFGGEWIATDGSHRLEAAYQLGLRPIFKKWREDWLEIETVRHLDADIFDACFLRAGLVDTKKLAAKLQNCGGRAYDF